MLTLTSKVFLILGILHVATPLSAEIVLKNSAGTMTASGQVTFPIEWDPVRQTTIIANISPQFGIFLFKGFELAFQARLKGNILNERLDYGGPSSSWYWGIGSSFIYQFDVDWPVIPYLGFGFSYEMAKSDITTANVMTDIPAGVLVPLNEYLALSFGISLQTSLVGQLKIFDKVRFEPGCFGLKAFF